VEGDGIRSQKIRWTGQIDTRRHPEIGHSRAKRENYDKRIDKKVFL
jgi:hypothetical protein